MTPPWKRMLTSKAVWAIILAHFAENWGFYTLLTGLPMFMRDVLQYKLDQVIENAIKLKVESFFLNILYV